MNKLNYVVLLATSLFAVLGCNSATKKQEEKNSHSTSQINKNLSVWPTITSEVKKDAALEKQVKSLLSTMTLEQKVAQMIQPEIRDITPEDMRKYGFGSYLNGGGAFPQNNKHATPQDWIALAEEMYQASIDDSLDGSTIPTIWGTDAVHGHNNVIGATLFPHNIGLGAAHNPELVEEIAKITATEVMVTGIDWVFAPTVATVRDDRWGRTYEGYSEDPEIVKLYAAAVVKGLQGRANLDFLSDNRVISTVKHFIGDGGTAAGDDQGNNLAPEEELYRLHAQGYVGGLTAGAQSVMASFNSWHGDKVHGNRYLLTDVLKNKMAFDGFVVGDWNGHGQIKGCTNESCPQAANAGLDIFMVPTDAWKPLMENTISQVKQGIIPISRIDDAVSRILRVKFRAGIFDKPSPISRQFSGKTSLIGNEKHREVAKQAVRESLVLLKNKDSILPLSPHLNVLVAGDAANNIGKQSGGWSITWQGTNNSNKDFPGGTSIYDGIAEQVINAGGRVTLDEAGEFTDKPDVAIVIFGEEPYAEGHGDRDNLVYDAGNKKDLSILKKLQSQGIPTVSIFISGRPMWVNPELNASDAFVAAWLPGSEGDAVADVLFKQKNGDLKYDFKGKLSFSWPKSPEQIVNRGDVHYQPLLPYGFGLRYGENSNLLDNLDENYQLTAKEEPVQQLFNGKVQKPWQLSILSDRQRLPVISSSQQLSGIEYRTIDRMIQEDAFKLTFKGTNKVGINFSRIDGLAENSFLEKDNDLAMVVTVLRDQPIKEPVLLSMKCEAQAELANQCQGSVDLSSALNNIAQSQWSNISIALNCFTKSGDNLSQLITPFELRSQGEFSMSISHIYFTSSVVKPVDIQCE